MMKRFAKVSPTELDKIKARALDPVALKMAWIEMSDEAEAKIFESMSPGEVSSTWGGNPLASAASLAVLDILEKEHLAENAQKVGGYLKARFHELQKKSPSGDSTLGVFSPSQYIRRMRSR
jgi:adenosylmethionine-8-amino-7-oxononanoate aminotransferase